MYKAQCPQGTPSILPRGVPCPVSPGCPLFPKCSVTEMSPVQCHRGTPSLLPRGVPCPVPPGCPLFPSAVSLRCPQSSATGVPLEQCHKGAPSIVPPRYPCCSAPVCLSHSVPGCPSHRAVPLYNAPGCPSHTDVLLPVRWGVPRTRVSLAQRYSSPGDSVGARRRCQPGVPPPRPARCGSRWRACP